MWTNYILGVVENNARSLIPGVFQANLNTTHSIFPPLESMGRLGSKDSIPQKKGDARFNIKKEILGFMINGVERSVWLSKAKTQSMASNITKLLWKGHVYA